MFLGRGAMSLVGRGAMSLVGRGAMCLAGPRVTNLPSILPERLYIDGPCSRLIVVLIPQSWPWALIAGILTSPFLLFPVT